MWDAKGRLQEQKVHVSPTSSKQGRRVKTETRPKPVPLSSNSLFVGELKSKTAKLLRSPFKNPGRSDKTRDQPDTRYAKLQPRPSSKDAGSLDKQNRHHKSQKNDRPTAKREQPEHPAVTECQPKVAHSAALPARNWNTQAPILQFSKNKEPTNVLYVPGNAPVARQLYELHQAISRKELQLANGNTNEGIKKEIAMLREQLNSILNTFANRQLGKPQPPAPIASTSRAENKHAKNPAAIPGLGEICSDQNSPPVPDKLVDHLDPVEISHHLCSSCGLVRGPDFHTSHPKLPKNSCVQNICSACRQQPKLSADLLSRHFCSGCGIVRSKQFQKEHPKKTDEGPMPNYCHYCQHLAAKSADIYEHSVISSVSDICETELPYADKIQLPKKIGKTTLEDHTPTSRPNPEYRRPYVEDEKSFIASPAPSVTVPAASLDKRQEVPRDDSATSAPMNESSGFWNGAYGRSTPPFRGAFSNSSFASSTNSIPLESRGNEPLRSDPWTADPVSSR